MWLEFCLPNQSASNKRNHQMNVLRFMFIFLQMTFRRKWEHASNKILTTDFIKTFIKWFHMETDKMTGSPSLLHWRSTSASTQSTVTVTKMLRGSQAGGIPLHLKGIFWRLSIWPWTVSYYICVIVSSRMGYLSRIFPKAKITGCLTLFCLLWYHVIFKLAPRSGTGLLQLLRVLPSFCVNNLSSIDWFYMT